jgi:hypothetical protein
LVTRELVELGMEEVEPIDCWYAASKSWAMLLASRSKNDPPAVSGAEEVVAGDPVEDGLPVACCRSSRIEWANRSMNPPSPCPPW